MMTRRTRLTGAAALALAAAAPACAQNVEARVAQAGGEVVQFHYASHAGVCGDGAGMMRVGGSFWSTTSGVYTDASRCERGPVRAVITKDGGAVIRLQLFAGPVTLTPGATDLGAMPAAEAARYFVELARTVEGRPARTAVMAAAMADSANVSDQLLAIARDANRARDLRSTALSWAARTSTPGGASRLASALDALARDQNERQSLRSSAVSGLGGLDGGAGVAALMAMSEADGDAWLAGQAVTVLARTPDARVRAQLRKLAERAATPEESRVKAITAIGNGDGTVRDAEFLRSTYPRFSEKERAAALTAVANIGDRASISWLLVRASDPAESMTLRRAAISRASRAGARVSELAVVFDGVPERELRSAVVDALAEDGSRPALDKLIAVAQSDADPTLRKRVISRLSSIGDARVTEALKAIIAREP